MCIRDSVYAGNGRDKGFGTGAEQQVIAFVGFSAALHMILVRQMCIRDSFDTLAPAPAQFIPDGRTLTLYRPA